MESEEASVARRAWVWVGEETGEDEDLEDAEEGGERQTAVKKVARDIIQRWRAAAPANAAVRLRRVVVMRERYEPAQFWELFVNG